MAELRRTGSHGVSISHRSSAAPAAGRIGRTPRTKRLPVITASTVFAKIRSAKVDVERGLIMIRGAVPGSKGGWIMVRDAVKRPHKDLPSGSVKRGRRRRRRAGGHNETGSNLITRRPARSS
jgi:large subunit ribosomal protein L3